MFFQKYLHIQEKEKLSFLLGALMERLSIEQTPPTVTCLFNLLLSLLSVTEALMQHLKTLFFTSS